MNWYLMENNIIREDLDALIEFLQQPAPRLTQGEQVALFEKEWSEWLGVKYSVFVNSGSSANFITMDILNKVYGVKDIAVSPLNWVSDVASILKAGMNPHFVDINLNTLGMDSIELKTTLNKSNGIIGAVSLTSLLGYTALTDDILSDAPILFEDCCEAHGTTFKGQKCGTFGLVSNFSFYYAHHMSTIEGGMICTNDEEVYQHARIMRSHGMVRESTSNALKDSYAKANPDVYPEFMFAYPGYNMRNTELGAVMGRNQLKRLDSNIALRNANNELFMSALDSERFMHFNMEGSSSYGLVVMPKEAADTAKCLQVLEDKGVEYRRGLAGGNQMLQPYMKNNIKNTNGNTFQNTNWAYTNGIYIGNYPSLDQNKVSELAEALNKC